MPFCCSLRSVFSTTYDQFSLDCSIVFFTLILIFVSSFSLEVKTYLELQVPSNAYLFNFGYLIYALFIPHYFRQKTFCNTDIRFIKVGFFAYGIGQHFNIRKQTVWYDSCPGGVGMLVFGDDPFYYFLQLLYPVWFRDDISETVLFVIAHNGIA